MLRFHGLARSGNHAVLHWMLHDAACSGKHAIWYNYYNGTEYKLHVLPPDGTDALIVFSFEDSDANLIKDSDEVLVRDPYNYWASRLKRARDTRTFIDPFVQRELWKSHARRATIVFNEWYKSAEYRDALALRLGFKRHDIMFDTWAQENGGSSFGDRDVLNHWQLMDGDPMWQCFFDEDVHALAREIMPDGCF